MSANVCSGCGASLSRSRLICEYCGRTTDLAIKTSEDEFELLREIARAAQKIGGEGASNESLEAFWQAGPFLVFRSPSPKRAARRLRGSRALGISTMGSWGAGRLVLPCRGLRRITHFPSWAPEGRRCPPRATGEEAPPCPPPGIQDHRVLDRRVLACGGRSLGMVCGT